MRVNKTGDVIVNKFNHIHKVLQIYVAMKCNRILNSCSSERLIVLFYTRYFPLFPVKNYTVNVQTMDVSGAGTDANVFINIYGDKGNSGERKLAKSETYMDKFERGHVSPLLGTYGGMI